MNGVSVLDQTDAWRLAKLHAASFPAPEVWSEKTFAELLVLKTTLALGIENDLALDACLLLQLTPDNADILTLATNPRHQRSGHARTLLEAGTQICGQRGIDRYLLDVAEDNATALAFYAAQGFSEDGRRKKYYTRIGKPAVDAILMSRSLARQH